MKKIILLLITAVTIVACSDSMLDKFPKDELSDGSFWKKEQDAQQALITLYGYLPMDERGSDVQTDNAVHGIKWAEGQVAKGIYDPTDGAFSGTWSSNYAGIRKCNILLENIDKIEEIDATVKKQIIAQARFFRAFLHFELAKYFGDVPLIEKSLNIEEATAISRTPVKDVVDFVALELKEAAADLPKTWDADSYGRITKGAALAMKARAEIFFGRNSDAATSAKSVMDLNTYELFDKDNTGKYAELFYSNDPGSAQKKEMVIETQRKAGDLANWMNTFMAPPGFGWGGLNPTQSFVDAFECTDGKTITESPLYDDSKPFENRDPRLEVCVLHHGETYQGKFIGTRPVVEDKPTGILTHGDATSTGYYQQKFLNPNEDTNGADAWESSLDWPMLRFAEVLLIFAEAKNETDGPTAEVYSAVNRIRKRVGMPDIPAGLSKDQMRIRIRREWRCEFGMEAQRWSDIRRWDIGAEVLNGTFYGMKYDEATKTAFVGKNVEVPIKRIYKSHNRVWPIPQSQLDLCPNLKQNKDY